MNPLHFLTSFDMGIMIKLLRERKYWSQYMLLSNNPQLFGESSLFIDYSSVSLARMENRDQTPSLNLFVDFLHVMKMPVETFFVPYLWDATEDMFALCERLQMTLERAAFEPSYIQTSEDLIRHLDTHAKFQNEINKQFVLSCQARLGLLKGTCPDEVQESSKKGLALTYPEFQPNTFEGGILLFCEPQLIHCLALAYAGSGNTADAIKLLERIQVGLTRLPQDDKHKEMHLVPILLDLAILLTNEGEHKRALDIFEKGNELAIKRSKGKYTSDYAYHKAKLLLQMNRIKEGFALLTNAYFGYETLRIYPLAEEVKAFAEANGLNINTHGVMTARKELPEMEVKRGKSISCHSLGSFIKGMRKDAKLSQDELCEGICNKSNLSKLEKDGITGNVYHLEGFMERLGLNIGNYMSTFLSSRDFDEKQMRNEVRTLLVLEKYDEAEKSLKELALKKAYKTGINRQFIEMSRADIYCEKHGYNTTHKQMVWDAFSLTKKDFDLDDISTTRLTNYEITLLNCYALNLCENDDLDQGVRIFEDLLRSVDRFYVDESEKLRTYILLLRNCARYMGVTGRRRQALKLADEGIEMCIKHGIMWHLPGLTVTKAYNLVELGKTMEEKEKGAPYFVMAYYCSSLIGDLSLQKTIKDTAKERLGLELH